MLRKQVGRLVQRLRAKPKRSILTLSALSTGISLGYLPFLTSGLSGFLIAKLLGAKEITKQSKIPSVVLPFGKYRLHLHHWLISSIVIVVALLKAPPPFPDELFCGFWSGIAFQGIYCYKDWYRILIRKDSKPATSKPQPAEPR